MRVKVGDGRLFFDVEGAKLVPDGPTMRERPTLLLLHGGPGFDHSSFKPDLSPLADVAQVVYLDHRGQGRSDRTAPARWNFGEWADDVRAFCEALEIEKPIVMGTSFGGMVAMAYGTRHPEHPAKLVLCTTTARVHLERILDTFTRLGGENASQTARRFFENPSAEAAAEYMKTCLPLYNRNPPRPEMLSRSVLNLDVAIHFFQNTFLAMNLLPGLARIQCPTLVMGGEDDPITPIADSEDIVAAIPKGLVRFERFPATGHGIVNDSRERFLAVLREFIAT
jgi:pimeloyl-ACP methyl ester carboxylesterase